MIGQLNYDSIGYIKTRVKLAAVIGLVILSRSVRDPLVGFVNVMDKSFVNKVTSLHCRCILASERFLIKRTPSWIKTRRGLGKDKMALQGVGVRLG